MKRILITGGAGFIGSHLVAALSDAGGYCITVVDNETSNQSVNYIPSVEYIKADIRDQKTMIPILRRTDIVVHLAAATEVIKSVSDPIANFDTNVVGTFSLLYWSCEMGVSRFIYASTGGAILGETTSPAHEEMAAKPLSPYGASKLASEGYCTAFANTYGMQTVSLRFSNVYGPGSFHKNSVIANFFKRILNNDELIVYGDGSQIRDYLYVKDLIGGIHAVIQEPVLGLFQLGSGQPTTLNELIQIIRDTTGRDIKIRYELFRKGEIHTTWCNIDKAKKLLNFNPSTSLSLGMALCWQWFLEGSSTSLLNSQ